MKCKDIKLLFMDFLYDEISDEDKKILQTHLASCDSCCQEFASLKQTSNIIKQWEDMEPNLNFVFVSETKSIWFKLKEKLPFSPKRLGYGLAIGFASVLLLLSLVNTEIHYEHGKFSLKMGIFPKKDAPQKVTDNSELIAQLQQQNVQLINALIQQSEERQRQQLINALAQFSREYENRRTMDLQLVGEGLNEIERSIYSRIERRTSSQMSDFIRYINTQQSMK